MFAEKAGIAPMLATQVVDEIVQKAPKAIELVQRSFMSEESKKKYLDIVGGRRRMLSYR